jgi:hypothetical protein
MKQPPSFAAVTASIHRNGMPYMAHVQAQEKAARGAAEIVQGLDLIMMKFLNTFKKETGFWPVKIIVYRKSCHIQIRTTLRIEPCCWSYGLEFQKIVHKLLNL